MIAININNNNFVSANHKSLFNSLKEAIKYDLVSELFDPGKRPNDNFPCTKLPHMTSVSFSLKINTVVESFMYYLVLSSTI